MAASRSLERRLATPPTDGAFGPSEIDGLPAAVQRYLQSAIAPGTPLARAVRLRMKGTIKLDRWVRFRAREVLDPHVGFVWPARAMGVVTGSDHFVDGEGVMDWRVLGLWKVAHAEGPDVSRSSANRGAAEAVWVPTALLPRFGVEWSAVGDSRLCARLAMGAHAVDLYLRIDPASGRPVSFDLERWGDPDESGTFRRGLVRWGLHGLGDLRRRHRPLCRPHRVAPRHPGLRVRG